MRGCNFTEGSPHTRNDRTANTTTTGAHSGDAHRFLAVRRREDVRRVVTTGEGAAEDSIDSTDAAAACRDVWWQAHQEDISFVSDQPNERGNLFPVPSLFARCHKNSAAAPIASVATTNAWRPSCCACFAASKLVAWAVTATGKAKGSAAAAAKLHHHRFRWQTASVFGSSCADDHGRLGKSVKRWSGSQGSK